ncbi:hypothetical protein NZD89_19975 [Alicyclobacillus fastidiosus]|uniref:DUF2059 domain-containing protein n=1 Tax=Alicyclobacillus fastidiosus TaxID=392011 RepID=A0ABY6ZEI5_9BACL|nr:hypothetical protein [Alicyclobacillus fastidiosus]WAH40574.1 hypothetical protein NZD89_19975 [Alicyclobacillus fastidiosus]GMA62009.1 hypothetical protein GCM10025859_24490 [Alicyclobacillus fastidiosus]
MKKFLIGLLAFVVIVGLGGYEAKNLLTKKVAEKIAADPGIHSTIQTALQQNPALKSQIQQYITRYGTGGLHFSSQQEALTYAMNHMSPSEAAKLYELYQNRDSLTPAQQQQVESEVAADFTPQQLAAMAQVFVN